MADPYPRLNVNPFQIPLDVQHRARRQRRAALACAPTARRSRRPSPFSAKSNTFIDPLLRTPYSSSGRRTCSTKLRRGRAASTSATSARAARACSARSTCAVPVDPRVTPVNGFTDIYDRLGRVINPDFFVPAEFLGLNRNGGFQQLTNIGRSTYHSLPVQAARDASAGRSSANVAYTLGRSMDTLSSDGGLVEHDPTRPENNFGPSDYDRTHRLTTSFMRRRARPRSGRARSSRAVTRRLEHVRHLHLPVGHAVLGHRQPDAQRLLRAGRRGRASASRPGMTSTTRSSSGPVQDRLDNYFNVDGVPRLARCSGATPAATSCADRRRRRSTSRSRARSRSRGRQRLELRWEVYNALNTPVFANPASTFAANGYRHGRTHHLHHRRPAHDAAGGPFLF